MVNSELGIAFTPQTIGKVKIENRIVRSATYLSLATEDGQITDDLITRYEELAEGGVGLTITGVSTVREDGKQLAKMMHNFSDDYLEGLTNLAGAYHDKTKEIGNNSKIFLQVGHCGKQTTHWGWQGELISSSDIENKVINKMPKKLSVKEIEEIVKLFAEATERAKKAGFDGVQFHGAHGYLINQFYSPYMNNREGDKYGGSIENRAKFTVEILKESQKKVGNMFPINLKMNGYDGVKGGLEPNEASELAIIFAKEGFNSLEISSYIHEASLNVKIPSLPPECQINVRQRGLEAFNLKSAAQIKEKLKQTASTNIPIILVGGIYRLEKINEIIDSTGIEFCSMCRPLIRQPNLPKLWRNGPPSPEAECIHCNQCMNEVLRKGPKCQGVRCIQKEKEERKRKKA